MATITSVNPYTWETNGTFERHTNEQLEEIINKAHTAYLSWKKTTFEERKQLFLKLADIIDEKNEELAELEVKEMWRLYSAATKWLRGTANLIRRFANNAEKVLWDQPFNHDWLVGKYKYDPLGVIYGVGPWNFPFNQVLRAAVPNILAGNTTVYKHASNVPFCGQAIEDLFHEAGFPKGIYTNLFSSWSQSEYILAHTYVRGTNLTWSEWAGSAVGALAGKYLKPSVLELGGNDAFVLLDHKDTVSMVAQAVACRVNNGGQRCNSSKRFIILEEHYDEFVKQMGEYMSQLTLWDPMDLTTDIPPMSSKKLIDEIHGQVTKTVKEWATLITWGEILGERQQFYAPTLLADVTPDMTSYKEEVFWPVASVIKSKSVEESIRLANDSDFWLSAVVFWDNIEECKKVAQQLEWGMIFVNNPAWSKASLPFGWVKKSWYGKENGPEWLRAFTNKKTIVYEVN